MIKKIVVFSIILTVLLIYIVNSIYKKTLGKVSTKKDVDEMKLMVDHVKKTMNLEDMKFSSLSKSVQKQILEKALKLLMRKQVMIELGIKTTAYKKLPKTVKRKVDVMTLLAIDESQNVGNKLDNSDINKYIDDTKEDSKQNEISKLRKMRMSKNKMIDEEDWNEAELKFSLINRDFEERNLI